MGKKAKYVIVSSNIVGDYRYEVTRHIPFGTLGLVSYYIDPEHGKEEGGVDVELMDESQAIQAFAAIFNVHVVDDETGDYNF